MNARIAAAVAVAVGCRVSSAGADPHPRVQLALDPCIDAPPDAVRRVVAIELGALLTDATDSSADCTRATVTCEGTVAVLRVDDPITGKSLSRTVDLGAAMPQARARLVALAVVELISASWTELDVNPEPRASPSGPRPSAEARAAALAMVRAQTLRRASDPLRVEVIGGVRTFPSGITLLGGGGLRVARGGPRLGWSIDAEAHHGTASVSLGEVSTDVLDVGPAMVVQQAWGRWSLRLGAGLRGGAVRMSGAPDRDAGAQGKAFWAPWVGPHTLGHVERAVTDGFVLSFGVEAGYVISPVGGLVGDRREVAVDGAWVGVDVGMGILL